MKFGLKLILGFILWIALIPAAKANVLDSLLNLLAELDTVETLEAIDQKSVLCNDIGVRYQGIDNDNKARFYFLQAIYFSEQRIRKQGFSDAQSDYDLAYLYQNIGVFESATGNPEQAQVYMERAEYFYKRLKNQVSADEYFEIILPFYKSNFARVYHARDDVAAEQYIKELELMVKDAGWVDKVEVYRLHGELYSRQERFDEAMVYMELAVNLLDSISDFGDFRVHQIIHSYVSVLFYKGNYKEVLDFLDTQPNYETFETAEKYGMQESVGELGNYLNTLFIRSYAAMKYQQETQNTAYLVEAFGWQKLGFKIAEHYILSHKANKLDGSISTAKNKVMAILNCAVRLQGYNLLKKNDIIELLRIVDVYQSARLHLERVAYDINQEVWEKQKAIGAELEFVNTKLAEKATGNINNAERDSLTERAYALSLSLQAIQQQSKQDKILAEYAIGQSGFEAMAEEFVQNKDKNILTYFYEDGADSLFIVGITPKENFILAIAVPENLITEIQELYDLNGKLQFDAVQIRRQNELNQLFYERLIRPVLPHLKSDELLIYPIDEMGYISFDALQDENGKYLIESFKISYTTSLFSMFTPKIPEEKLHSFAAFYPTDYGADSLAYLLNAKTEIESINKTLDGQVFDRELATKAKFFEVVDQFKILHIASHSILDYQHPYESSVLFDASETADNRLFAYEIFSKTINAEMVILSSCNSAHGKIEEGIGVVSLSNAFYFAGTPSTVSSLWSAQDRSSSEIMIDFYTELYAGNSKSASLRSAKMNYLEKADKVHRQPFFWANYVIYGSDDALFVPKAKNTWVNYAIGGVMCILLFFIGRRFFRLTPSKA